MNFWKKMPYWLRGGMIGGGVVILLILLYNSCFFVVPGYTAFLCGIFISHGPVHAVFWFMQLTGLEFLLHDTIWGPVFSYNYTKLFIISVVVWFFIGTLIGALVGYIKSKNNQ